MPAAETWDSNPTLTGQRSPQVLNSQRQCKRNTRPSANMTSMSTNTKARARAMLRGDMLELQCRHVPFKWGLSHAFFLWQPRECPGAHPGRRACRRAPPASAATPSQRRRSTFHTKPASCHSQGCILARRCAKLGQGMQQDAPLLGAFRGTQRASTWPMRWQRSIAWSSMAEFQYGSISTTLVATCRRATPSRAQTRARPCRLQRPWPRRSSAKHAGEAAGHAGARWGARTPPRPRAPWAGAKRADCAP